MSEVIASIDIAAPLEDVWEYALDFAHIREWVTIVDSIGYLDPGPLRPGFRMDQTLQLRGVRFTVHWTCKRLEAPRYVRWEGQGPAGSTAATQQRLSRRNGLTRFDYHNDFRTRFGPLGAAASKVIVGGVPQKEANASLRRLKEILEQRAQTGR
jgi:uncharacterized membrane protein